MAYTKKSYVEHVAVRVRDIDWHIRFFREALGMSIREVDGPADSPKQVWTVGGVQLLSDPEFRGPEGRLAHLGVMTEDSRRRPRRSLRVGRASRRCRRGRNWLALPDGLCVEVLQATGDSVSRALAVDPRA